MKQHTNSVCRRENRASTEQNLAPKCSEHPRNCEVVITTAGTRVADKHFSFQNYEGAKKFIKQQSQISYEVQNFKNTRSGLRQTRVRRPKRTRLRRRTNARIPRTWTSCALLSRIWTRVSTKPTSSRHISRSCRRSSTHCMMRKMFKILKRRVVQYPFKSQACRLFSEFFLSSQPKPRLLKTRKLDSPLAKFTVIKLARRDPLREGAHLNMHQCTSPPQPRFARMLPDVKVPPQMDEVLPSESDAEAVLVISRSKNALGHRRSAKRRRISKTAVCSGSGHPKEAMPWIREIDLSNSIDDLQTSQSIAGRKVDRFPFTLCYMEFEQFVWLLSRTLVGVFSSYALSYASHLAVADLNGATSAGSFVFLSTVLRPILRVPHCLFRQLDKLI